MMYYHQQHVRYDQQYGVADALSRLGVSKEGTIVPIQQDQNGKPDKSIQPIIDPKALQLFQARTQSERIRASGALDALNRIGAKQLERALSDPQGLTDALKGQRIQQSVSRTNLNNAQLGKVLGLIPPTQQLPTGGQILAEQRSLRKERFTQRGKLYDFFTNNGINDPQMLLGGFQVNVPVPGKIYGTNPNFIDATVDDKGNVVIPKGATEVKLDDGTKLSIKQFNRLYPQAQKWQQLGTNLPAIKTPPPHDVQMLLQDPSDQKKAYFDQVYGHGASDLVISAQGKAAAAQPAQQQEPPDTESAEDVDTSGEEENPADAGGE
jgi:hypothetical protein